MWEVSVPPPNGMVEVILGFICICVTWCFHFRVSLQVFRYRSAVFVVGGCLVVNVLSLLSRDILLSKCYFCPGEVIVFRQCKLYKERTGHGGHS